MMRDVSSLQLLPSTAICTSSSGTASEGSKPSSGQLQAQCKERLSIQAGLAAFNAGRSVYAAASAFESGRGMRILRGFCWASPLLEILAAATAQCFRSANYASERPSLHLALRLRLQRQNWLAAGFRGCEEERSAHSSST